MNAKPVPYPRIDGDLGATAGRYAAALGQANGRIAAVRACDAAVREEYKRR